MFYTADLEARKQMTQEKRLPCPCCGYIAPQRLYRVCAICAREDVYFQLNHPLQGGCANRVPLLEGQQNYLAFGACEERLKQNTRPPLPDEQRIEGWRPIDLRLDSSIVDPEIEDQKQRIIYWLFLGDVRKKHRLDASSDYYWSHLGDAFCVHHLKIA